MKNKLFFLTILASLVLIGAISYFVFTHNQVSNQSNQNIVPQSPINQDLGCIGEGNTLFPNDGNKCCADLRPEWNYNLKNDGTCEDIQGALGHQLICIKCRDGICGNGENGCNCPQDCKNFKCKVPGEIPNYTAPGDDMSTQCCKGLKHRIQKNQFDENCVNLFEKYGGGGYVGICLACGDGVCDSKYESKCNCPEDCK